MSLENEPAPPPAAVQKPAQEQLPVMKGETHGLSKVLDKRRDLRWIVEEAGGTGVEEAIDVAVGTGDASLALAPHVRHITTLDSSSSTVSSASSHPNVTHLAHLTMPTLPFPPMHADLVLSRYATHNFSSALSSAHEYHRVLKVGGRLILVDVVSPESDDFAAFLDEVGTARDPGYVRARRLSEWIGALEEAGFDGLEFPHVFDAEIRVPVGGGERARKMEGVLEKTGEDVREYFDVERKIDGEWGFKIPMAMIVATAVERAEKKAPVEQGTVAEEEAATAKQTEPVIEKEAVAEEQPKTEDIVTTEEAVMEKEPVMEAQAKVEENEALVEREALTVEQSKTEEGAITEKEKQVVAVAEE
ncbi:S-adenosyl-L-methionine-dependent methyltransferase [Jimgerdemannia flammicorona]|uniref:S-adenosyl-L-methionine-dependent methyltransferase n=1 Tax=Jimgerdemannia flammicorona TaxID=994334 RepID=A0A433D6W6_9FUNG|nr:S-adenosyl-L-methionine-dependent methyltransferase [Jimgerdemannia flammicorona]